MFLLLPVVAHAALVGRLPDAYGQYQAVYDTDLDITWLADANYAATSGYDADGRMTWDAAQFWMTALNVADHLGSSDWRLPVSNGCISYNCTGSELGHLFYLEFGGVAGYGDPMPSLSDVDLALFSNIQIDLYWSATEYQSSAAWTFEFGPYDVGRQIYFPKDMEFYAWAVHGGDILATPLPATLGLFGSGLMGLLGLARKKPV
ncbi:MAG: DUF1566 domain-containing protein [Gammaproteobacteria bacterium]|nr:DUF1566 domain-containing protein [Gammaproteobacteria bacterium]